MRQSWVTISWLACSLLSGCASWEEQRRSPRAPATAGAAEVAWTPVQSTDHVVPASGMQSVGETERVARPSKTQGVAQTASGIVAVGATEVVAAPPKDSQPTSKQTFTIPAGLPGADAEPIMLPALKDLSREEREKRVREAYPVLVPLPDLPQTAPPTSGQPYSLLELQALAMEKNPAIQRATADVDSAYGTMIQAGLYPNPHIGYQGDQIQPGDGPKNNAGQQGAFLQQLIKTCHKLSLARTVAGMDYANAQIALRRAQLDVINQIRIGFYTVLVSRETMSVSRTLSELADQVYLLQLRHVATGEAAGYEPLQLYAQSVQARNTYIQASNRYVGAWKQLAANLGMPDMPLQPLTGSADAPLPEYDADMGLQRILDNHTDVLTALNTVVQTHTQMRLAQVTPVPDIALGAAVQHDNSVGNNQVNVQVGFAIPVFDQNQGNIRAAAAMMARAQHDLRARRNDLNGRFAEAMARYRSGKSIVANYRDRILPNLSRAYRTIYQRYLQEPEKVGFNDIVVAQQNLGQALNAYLVAIGDQWTAVIDVANLLQIDDLYQTIEK